jgi:hypothetical protein
MTWIVKVVAVVRQAGRTAEGLRAIIAAGEAAFAADCRAALVGREVAPVLRWKFKAVQVATNTYELYPKAEITLPTHEADPRPADPTTIQEKLAACRDAIVARLEQLAAANGWTILRLRTDLYGTR